MISFIFIFLSFPMFAGSSGFLFCVCFDLFLSFLEALLKCPIIFGCTIMFKSEERKSQSVEFHSWVIWHGTDFSIEEYQISISRGLF